ncbi:MAG: O-antigen polymerase [Rubrivivax sp.]|nr:O-antigen polymerase [Rubrivivax sp.]
MQFTLQFAVVAALITLAVGGAVFVRDATHPAALLPGLWGLVGAAYLLLPHSLRPIGMETWLLVAVACAAFVLACVAATGAASSVPDGHIEPTVWQPLFFWASVLGLPLFAYQAFAIAESAAFTESMLINLRIALTGELDDAQTYGVLGYLVPMSFTSTLVELATSPRRLFTPRGWIALVVSLAYAVMSTGRTYLFLLFIALAFVALVQRRIRPATLAWFGTAAVGVLFFGLGWLFNKIGDDSPNVNALGAVDALSLYLLGSLAGLDVWTATPAPLDWGLNVFRSVLAVGSALGLRVQVVPLVKDYVFVPEPTNVYTVFLPYLQDYGRLGAVTFLAFFGWMHARLYRAARSQDPRWVILYALAMYPLLMQFFQDQYFSLLTTWAQFTVMVLLCFRRRQTADPT